MLPFHKIYGREYKYFKKLPRVFTCGQTASVPCSEYRCVLKTERFALYSVKETVKRLCNSTSTESAHFEVVVRGFKPVGDGRTAYEEVYPSVKYMGKYLFVCGTYSSAEDIFYSMVHDYGEYGAIVNGVVHNSSILQDPVEVIRLYMERMPAFV